MSDAPADGSQVVVIAAAPRRRGRPLLAWAVILLTVVATVGLRLLGPVKGGPPATERASMLLVQMQARYLLGAARWLGQKSAALDAQVKALNTGPIGQRLRAIILVGERDGPAAALDQLEKLSQKLDRLHVRISARQEQLVETLARLYGDYSDGHLDAPSLGPEDRRFLRNNLGWFGDLALAPAGGPDPAAREAVLRAADRTALALMGAFALYGVLGVAGLVGLVVCAVRAFKGQLRRGLNYRSPYGGVYAETFALWMVVFMGLSLAAGYVAGPETRLFSGGVAMLFSLVVLAWPVLRGVRWRQVRADLGLFPGRHPALEPGIGLAGYAMAMPLLAVGALLVVLLVTLQRQISADAGDPFGSNGMPVHPVIEFMTRPDWWSRAQVLLVASVVAPLVEETLFRGVLYRHLREASAGLGDFLSILVSGIVVSFLFAVIHPQGLLAVPALMALAFAFALIREWRGTLVPCMVAHGLNNGLVMILLMLALGS